MGKFILDLVNTSNAFWLSFMDKCIAIMHEITTGGRKMTVTIFAVFCMTCIAVQCIATLATLPTTLIVCLAGVVGFFHGVNILGDHILNGKQGKPSDDKSKDGD